MAVRDGHESEWKTRKTRIDEQLRRLGWKVTPYDRLAPSGASTQLAVEEYPTANGPADYALVVDGQLLGVTDQALTPLCRPHSFPCRVGAVRPIRLLASSPYQKARRGC